MTDKIDSTMIALRKKMTFNKESGAWEYTRAIPGLNGAVEITTQLMPLNTDLALELRILVNNEIILEGIPLATILAPTGRRRNWDNHRKRYY